MVDITNKPSDTTPRATGPAVQPGPYDRPGSDLYDWYKINDALRASQMDGWQIGGTSHQPVPTGAWVDNPEYTKIPGASQAQLDELNQGKPAQIWQENKDYRISVVNPQTGQMLLLTMGKSAPDAQGGYSYNILGRTEQGKLDKTTPGYANPQVMEFKDGRRELWGTNSGTGNFEKMPGSPPDLGDTKGWTNVQQIDDNQGHKVWVGTNPQGQPLQRIEGAPIITVDKYLPGSVKQVVKNGRLVYVGINATTQQPEDIPGYGSEPVKPTVTTVNKNVYTTDPNGNLVLATAIAQPQENDEQWVDAGTGYAKHQTFHNGDWHDDTDVPQKSVNPATQRAEAALKPKGTKYWIPLTGSSDTMIEVTADGNGGYTYEMGPNGEPPAIKKIPGIREPTSAGAAGATDEFLPQRRDPTTGALLPPERNINWQPAGVGDRMRQLQSQAQSKMDELHTQVKAGTLSEDDADKQFNTWWDQNIEPSRQEIQIAQQNKQQDVARQNLQVAQDAGRSVVTATAGEHRVGPGFGDFWSKISQGYGKDMPTNMTADDWNRAFVTEAPDYSKVYEQATAQALAHISPTAAQIATGQPNPTGLAAAQNQDITAGLGRNPYLYKPGPVQMPGMPVAPLGTPGGAVPMPNGPAVAPVGSPGGAVPMPNYNPQGSTAALNAGGFRDTPQGRAAAIGSGQAGLLNTPTPAVPAAAAPPTGPMGSSNYAALLARMEQDREEQRRQQQATLNPSWNAWGTYQPGF